MLLRIVEAELKQIAFTLHGINVDEVETVHFGAWLIRIAAILQEICSFFDS